MHTQRSTTTIIFLTHLIFPVVGWAIGVASFSHGESHARLLTDLFLQVPLFRNVDSQLSMLAGSTSADRAIYITLFWAISLVPMTVGYTWVAIQSIKPKPQRNSRASSQVGVGQTLAVIVLCGLVSYYCFFAQHDFTQTRLERLTLLSDFKFFVYTCAFIPWIWAWALMVQLCVRAVLKLTQLG